MSKPLPVSALAGALSFAAFLISVSGLFPSILLMHFAAVPLFAAAFVYGARGVSIAAAVALTAALAPGSAGVWSAFATSIALPAWFAGLLATRRTDIPGPTPWYPVSKLIVWLSIYASLRVLMVSLLHADTPGGFQGAVEKTVQSVLVQMPAEAIANASGVIKLFPYLIPISEGWSWVLLIWFAAWFSHFVLHSYRLGVRSEFSIRFFLIPNWLLMLVAGTAGASLLSTGEAQFVALIVTLILLLPYFLLGIMYIHSLTRPWPARWLVLTFFYLLLLKLWPILLVALLGIILHAHSISRHWFTPGGASGKP